MIKIYLLYLLFLRMLVDKKYLQKYEHATVLGERFIGRYYVVVFKVEKNGNITYHIIVENIKKTTLINLSRASNDDGYTVFEKYNFQRQMKDYDSLYKSLANNGLYKNIVSSYNGKNGPFSVHRLVTCLYLDIKNREVHHITKEIETRNDICALIRVFEDSHDTLDRLPLEISVPISLRIQNRMKRKIFKTPRNTLTQNNTVIEAFLKKEVA